MAIPSNAVVWPEVMDPYDVLDYTVDVSDLLEAGENVASFTVTPLAESALVGLTLGTSSYATSIAGNVIRIWLSIASGQQDNAAFNGTGATLPIEISVTTTSTPPRKKQRTAVVKVAQR